MRADGKRFASAAARSNFVRLWNGENNQQVPKCVAASGSSGKSVGSLGPPKFPGAVRGGESIGHRSRNHGQARSTVPQKQKVTRPRREKTTEKTAAAKQPSEAKVAAEKDLASATDAARQATDKAAAAKTAADKDAKNRVLAKAADDTRRASDEAQQKLTQAKQRVNDATRNAERPIADRKRAEDAIAGAVRLSELAEQSSKKAARPCQLPKVVDGRSGMSPMPPLGITNENRRRQQARSSGWRFAE